MHSKKDIEVLVLDWKWKVIVTEDLKVNDLRILVKEKIQKEEILVREYLVANIGIRKLGTVFCCKY